MIYSNYRGEQISRLGMGNMRLPTLPTEGHPIDYEKGQEMIDYCMGHGITYYDTAYVYHGGESEVFVGKALAKYPRESYKIATKFNYGANPDFKAQFDESLRRLDKDYIDFYLLHAIGDGNWADYRDSGCIEYFLELKEQGKIKNLGFSFHGSPKCLREVVAYREWDFAQIQMNYFDWLYSSTKEEYEILEAAGIPVVVMESIRGGRLADLTEEPEKLLKAAHPDWSIASWALRWLQRHPSVFTMLSGMSTLEHVVDNTNTCAEPSALSDADAELLLKACELFHEKLVIPCTACRYCTDTCPAQINIPELLKVYNEFKVDGPWALGGLEKVETKGMPADCIGCGVCTGHCPQSIDIPTIMAEFAETLTKFKRD